MRNLFNFVAWVFCKLFASSMNSYKKFGYGLRDSFWETTFLWALLTLLVTTVSGLLAGLITSIIVGKEGRVGDVPVWVGLTILFISMLLYISKGVTILYRAFKADQERVFNVLKEQNYD